MYPSYYSLSLFLFISYYLSRALISYIGSRIMQNLGL
jgi:hypothetical protein